MKEAEYSPKLECSETGFSKKRWLVVEGGNHVVSNMRKEPAGTVSSVTCCCFGWITHPNCWVPRCNPGRFSGNSRTFCRVPEVISVQWMKARARLCHACQNGSLLALDSIPECSPGYNPYTGATSVAGPQTTCSAGFSLGLNAAVLPSRMNSR